MVAHNPGPDVFHCRPMEVEDTFLLILFVNLVVLQKDAFRRVG